MNGKINNKRKIHKNSNTYHRSFFFDFFLHEHYYPLSLEKASLPEQLLDEASLPPFPWASFITIPLVDKKKYS